MSSPTTFWIDQMGRWERQRNRLGSNPYTPADAAMGAQTPPPAPTPTRTPMPTNAPTPKPTGERLPNYWETANPMLHSQIVGLVPSLTGDPKSTYRDASWDRQQMRTGASPAAWGSLFGSMYDAPAGNDKPSGSDVEDKSMGGGNPGSYRSRNAWLDGLQAGLSQWADAFEDEHRGRSVFEVYGGAPAEDLSNSQINYALSDALLDKAWGDKFYDTYHRAPSEDDWKASFYDRERLKARNESPWGGRWQG